MANPLPNEDELFRKIREEKITIDPMALDFLYRYIGDDITAIDLLCQYYLMINEPLPASDAQRILIYTRDAEFIIKSITRVSAEHIAFPQFKDMIPLHETIKDLLTYHFGNGIYVINLIVQDSLDPANKEPRQIPVAHTQKILEHTCAIKAFMEKLRLAAAV